MGGSVVVKSSTREPCEHLSLFKAALCSLMQAYAVSAMVPRAVPRVVPVCMHAACNV
jgi:hypothetical protein